LWRMTNSLLEPSNSRLSTRCALAGGTDGMGFEVDVSLWDIR
jgi:hypothetical protein